ncbi:ORF6N domain-containing protein [Clostridium magnum]|uniref:ORF6N domain-containing protein n=1 Tax=Clostridium magnum TaxID=33954 RepID=UPI00090F375C|nr:ORF6N domain-containing protein [Clostridium magnum]SHJ28422.1 ORF6N domain-containing protein [Clostridium magnum DSM 2767]
MNDLITINNQEMQVKEYKGQRVVTFKDIDLLHERVDGTARRNFNENKKHFISNTDFFFVKPKDVQTYEIRTSEINNAGTYLITESGYLMLVKSFTDDLAWKVQRELINNYFVKKELQYILAQVESEIKTIVNNAVKEEISKVEQKCSNYYRPTHLTKYKISSYIKNKLGISKANKEYELVKLRILIMLRANKWEDIPIEILSNSLSIIDECIDVIKKDRNFDQISLFDTNKKMPFNQASNKM